jgi:hypothetical protein
VRFIFISPNILDKIENNYIAFFFLYLNCFLEQISNLIIIVHLDSKYDKFCFCRKIDYKIILYSFFHNFMFIHIYLRIKYTFLYFHLNYQRT